MPDTPLNPDALAQAKAAAVDCRLSGCSTEDVAECAVETYLSVAHPVLDETALANSIAWKSLPFGATEFVKLDANASHKVIELLRPHLTVAQPEVNSIEELNALPVRSVFEDADGCIFEIVHNGERNSDGTFYREYLMTGDIHPYDIDEIDLPATVLKRAPKTPRR